MKVSADIWKWVAGILVSILLSVTGTFYAVAGDFATKTEMHDSLKPDHDMIVETRNDVKALNDKLDHLNREVGEIEALLRATQRR